MFHVQDAENPNENSAAKFVCYEAEESDVTRSKKAGRKPELSERKVIAWDMEGMNLSGDNKPQHPVLFGCSAEVESPLIARKISTMDMLELIVRVGVENPYALHVGYGFRYDANMIIQDLSPHIISTLWKQNHVRFTDIWGDDWTVGYINGKKFTVTKYDGKRSKNRRGNKVATVTIYDYSSFFGGKTFLGACEDILREDLTDDDREVIEHGKAERGSNTWNNLGEVRHYWTKEIVLIQRTFERFRDVMFKAGFALSEWYGPGALANYINTVRKIRTHLVGVQNPSGFMPTEVHEASKVAFSGGRFELFNAGRHVGPIYTIDINSAYPYALTMLPSFETGEWKHVTNPTSVERFGIYRISFEAPDTGFFEYRPMPLFYRDKRGLISYPNRVHGWYYSPEARNILGMRGATIHEGWYWDTDSVTRPWAFLQEMYDTRTRLGKKNLLSLPFKLGPNSLYGKYAQTVGWDEKNFLPPKSHALPVAGWVTSYCRAMLWNVISQVPDKVIGVETDSVFTTVNPVDLDLVLGDELGQWGVSEYEEIVYFQSGMYHLRSGGEWKGTKSRGMNASEFPAETAINYMQSLIPGVDWEPLKIQTKPRFIGAGAALARNNGMQHHCVWERQERSITFGEMGKRRHVHSICRQCGEGKTPWDEPHRLVIQSPSDGVEMSHPRTLPWEKAYTREIQTMREMKEYDENIITLT